MKTLALHTLLRIVALFCLFFITVYSKAQSVDSTLTTYADKYGQERVYLHYDKTSYAPGETIWFRAYLMEGIEPAVNSNTLYADWIDDKGRILYHSVCPVVESATNGQLDIPENYTGNVIHVRAYTKWMLNFDTAFLYNKDIRILSKNPATTTVAKANSIPSLQFFPEGGDAVTGIKNKIAFKANDQWGRPVAVKGVIVNDKGAVVDSFRSVHDGMGFFWLVPQAEGAIYKARWKDAKGAEQITTLPAIKGSGITVQVTVAGNKRILTVNRTGDAADNLKSLHIIGTMQQRLVFKTDAGLAGTTSATKTIPTETLPTGILTITVFDAGWNALAERITFVNNENYAFPTEMTVQHWGLNKRARNEIQIAVPANVQANLSVAVTDAALDRDSSDNIISHLLLASDIKGNVYRPAYYFTNNSDTISSQLDLVMLTHGWRRFKWEDVVKGRFPAVSYPRDTSYLSLSGKVMGISKNQLSTGGMVILIIRQNDSASKIMMLPVEPNGNFSNPNFVFFDTLNIYYQFQKSKSISGAEVRFMNERLAAMTYPKTIASQNPFWDTTGSYRLYKLAEERAKLLELLRGKTLENVTVRASTKSPVQVLDEKYTSGLFKGSDSYQFDLVNDPAAASSYSIFNYLQGKVAGLQISESGSNVSMQWRGGSPQLYLDEVQTDVSMISNIPVSDVAYIKVFRPPFVGGFGGGNGAIAIYTRRGSDRQNTPGKGLNSNTVMGYTPVKQFYAPNYAAFVPKNEQRDVRTTIYWNPLLKVSPNKHVVTFYFYNNDVTNSFRVVIEGMSTDGQLTHVEQVME
jgi:hypothetical protein